MTENRESPIEIFKEEFKKIGYQLIDTIAHFFDTIDKRPVTPGGPSQAMEDYNLGKFGYLEE